MPKRKSPLTMKYLWGKMLDINRRQNEMERLMFKWAGENDDNIDKIRQQVKSFIQNTTPQKGKEEKE